MDAVEGTVNGPPVKAEGEDGPVDEDIVGLQESWYGGQRILREGGEHADEGSQTEGIQIESKIEGSDKRGCC